MGGERHILKIGLADEEKTRLATMFPSRPDPDTPKSERRVFEVLEESLPNSWVVFHARRLSIPASRGLIEKEVDFVVLDPERGYLGLEVKGGKEIGRDQDGWYSIDHYDNKNRLGKDPGQQAQSAVHTLARFLERSPDFRRLRYPYGWGVAFPAFSATRFADPSLPRDLVVDREDLSDAKSAIDRLFDVNGIEKNAHLAALKNAFTQAIYPSLRLAATLADRIAEDEPELVRLTNEQFDLLDQLDEMDEVVVKGGAGTGKTMLAMEKAGRLAKDGKRVLFLCYNKPLADYLQRIADGFTVRTFHQFCSEMARAAGLGFRVPKSTDDQQEFWDNTAPTLLEQAAASYPDDRYDAIIVDEGQDFQEAWWIALLNYRAQESVFYIFADPNQKLYERAVEDAAEMLSYPSVRLKYNCRNTKKIASYCGELIGVEQFVKEGAPEGIDIVTERCESAPDMVDGVRRHLHRLVRDEGVDPSSIVILSAGNYSVQRSPVWNARHLANCRLVELGTEPEANEVVMSTTRRFKGLESDVVIVCDVDEPEGHAQKNAEYVAYTRARHVLVILTN